MKFPRISILGFCLDMLSSAQLVESDKSVNLKSSEEVEDATWKEKREKSMFRRRGPYRKAHSGW